MRVIIRRVPTCLWIVEELLSPDVNVLCLLRDEPGASLLLYSISSFSPRSILFVHSPRLIHSSFLHRFVLFVHLPPLNGLFLLSSLCPLCIVYHWPSFIALFSPSIVYRWSNNFILHHFVLFVHRPPLNQSRLSSSLYSFLFTPCHWIIFPHSSLYSLWT